MSNRRLIILKKRFRLTGVIEANAMTDKRTLCRIPARRKCSCGCRGRATHMGMANGCGMMCGCEFTVRMWVRNPNDELCFSMANRKLQSDTEAERATPAEQGEKL